MSKIQFEEVGACCDKLFHLVLSFLNRLRFNQVTRPEISRKRWDLSHGSLVSIHQTDRHTTTSFLSFIQLNLWLSPNWMKTYCKHHHMITLPRYVMLCFCLVLFCLVWFDLVWFRLIDSIHFSFLFAGLAQALKTSSSNPTKQTNKTQTNLFEVCLLSLSLPLSRSPSSFFPEISSLFSSSLCFCLTHTAPPTTPSSHPTHSSSPHTIITEKHNTTQHNTT